MDGAAVQAIRRYGRFAATAAGVAAGLAALAALLLREVPGGPGAAALGCGISLAASLIAAWPVARFEARLGRAPAAALLAGSAVRPFVAVLAALAAVAAGVEPRAPLLVATAASYLALLVPGSLYAQRGTRAAPAPEVPEPEEEEPEVDVEDAAKRRTET